MIVIHKAIPCDECDNGVYIPYGYWEHHPVKSVSTLIILECPECGCRINEEIKHNDPSSWEMIKTMLIEAGYVIELEIPF